MSERLTPTPEDARIQERMLRRVLTWAVAAKADATRTLVAVQNACLDYIVFPPGSAKIAVLRASKAVGDAKVDAITGVSESFKDKVRQNRARATLGNIVNAVPAILPGADK